MSFKYRLFSFFRRLQRANLILFTGIPVMRFYQSCVSRQVLYVMFSESEHCKQYVRFYRQYDLASSHKKIKRLYRQEKELFNKA
jgi:hypothetical protein